MRKLIVVVLSAVVLIALALWDERPGHDVPKWVFLIAVAPLVWVKLSSDADRYEASDTRNGFALLYLFGASIFLMIMGALGRSMHGTWGAVLEPALYIGAIAFVLAIVTLIFRSRS